MLCVGRPEGTTREFVRILQLDSRFPTAVIAAAVEQALTLRRWSAESVEHLVRQEGAAHPVSAALDPAVLARLPDIDIPLPDLERFAQLLAAVSA